MNSWIPDYLNLCPKNKILKFSFLSNFTIQIQQQIKSEKFHIYLSPIPSVFINRQIHHPHEHFPTKKFSKNFYIKIQIPSTLNTEHITIVITHIIFAPPENLPKKICKNTRKCYKKSPEAPPNDNHFRKKKQNRKKQKSKSSRNNKNLL